jgi:hypothetical protein
VDFAINTALTVVKIDYVLVKTFNQYTFEPVNVVLAKNLVAKQFGKGFSQVKTMPILPIIKPATSRFHSKS